MPSVTRTTPTDRDGPDPAAASMAGWLRVAFPLIAICLLTGCSEANRYVDEQAPWVLSRSDPARMRTVLYTLAETLRHLAIMVQPFVPGAAHALLDQLAVPETMRDFASLAKAPLAPGTRLPKPEAIFPRFLDDAAR